MQTCVGDDPSSFERQFKVGDILGHWCVSAFLPRGGMADVYTVERSDGQFDHRGALKVLRINDEKRKLLFQAERQRLAQLDHPGIARIIDGGHTQDGFPYMVVEYVEGGHIDTYAEELQKSSTERLELFLQAAAAIEYAHKSLVLHRDLKPANMLVAPNGLVRVIDFGVSSDIQGKADTLASGFTPAYAAPEQLSGDPVTVQSDVFSLGLVLYELLLGERPNRCSDNSIDTAATHRLGKDLSAVIAKATATAPTDRYGSVRDFADDIRALMAGRAIEARNRERFYPIQKLYKQNRVPVLAGASAILILGTALTISLFALSTAQTERERALSALDQSAHFLERANTEASVSQTFASVTQHLIAIDGDTDRHQRLLRTMADDAHRRYQEDPSNAALVAFSIGQYFLERLDLVSAEQTLSRWLNAGYGSEAIRMKGLGELGLVYVAMGRRDLAISALSDVDAYYAASFEAQSLPHLEIIGQLAKLRRDRASLEKALDQILAALEETDQPADRRLLLGQVTRLSRLLNDYELSYTSLRELTSIDDGQSINPNTAQISANRFRLAVMELGYKRDTVRAVELAQRIIATSQQEIGGTRELPRARVILGLVAMEKGHLDAAEQHLRTAIDEIMVFAGVSSVSYRDMQAVLGDILAQQGQIEEAVRRVKIYQERMPKTESASASNRLALGMHAVNAGASQHGLPLPFEDIPTIDFDSLQRSIRLTYYYDRLVERGVLNPS